VIDRESIPQPTLWYFAPSALHKTFTPNQGRGPGLLHSAPLVL
jgi:hypothetical protein